MCPFNEHVRESASFPWRALLMVDLRVGGSPVKHNVKRLANLMLRNVRNA